MPIGVDELRQVARTVLELCGVVLDDSKGYLVESRLDPLLSRYNCASYTDLCLRARYETGGTLRNDLIDAITTQETLFFRDGAPFEAMRNIVLPQLIAAKAQTAFPRRIRVWSAACSTGQEVYSVAMALAEALGDLSSWDVQIVGTDISERALAQAREGCYNGLEIGRGLSRELLSRHFTATGTGWRANDEVRKLATFTRLNLLEPFRMLGPFDIVFCRNVAIYFNDAARADLFNRISAELTNDGYLFVGASESLAELGPRFTPMMAGRAIYYRPNIASARTLAVSGAPPAVAAVPPAR